VLGDGVVALAPIILPFLAPDLVRVVDAALALEALYPQMQEALAQTNQWANTQIGRAPGMLDGLVRALAPAWFADSVWPILRDVGAFLGGMLIEVVVELVRDFLIPSWGIYREDLPALWKGMVRAKDSIIAWDPLAFSLALTDIEIAVLSAAGRIEWSLGCWLLVIGALSGLAGGAIGGGAAATVSGGTATPVGATVAGTATTVTIGGTAYSIGEATGLILAGASLFTDLGRFVLTLFAYLDDDQPPEERQRLLNDLVATGFRIVIVVLMLGLAFAASRVGKAAGKAAEVAMQQTALKQAAAELDDLVRQIRAGAPLELPLSTPAIEMDHSPAHASLAPVLDLFRKHLEIDGTPQYLGSRVSISDDASFERYIAADMLLQDPGLSTEAALQYSRRVAGFYLPRDNHRIMLRTGLRPEDVPGILAHETTHFVSPRLAVRRGEHRPQRRHRADGGQAPYPLDTGCVRRTGRTARATGRARRTRSRRPRHDSPGPRRLRAPGRRRLRTRRRRGPAEASAAEPRGYAQHKRVADEDARARERPPCQHAVSVAAGPRGRSAP
jgi:hypothetical protein